MSRILGNRGASHSKPQSPVIAGRYMGDINAVSFVPGRLNAAVRDPLYAEIGEFTTLGQRNVQQLMDALKENAAGAGVSTTEDGTEILYPGKSPAEREALLGYLNDKKVLGLRSERMQRTILQPILNRLKDFVHLCKVNLRLKGVEDIIVKLVDAIATHDKLDTDSQALTIKNHIFRIACKAHEGSQVREATGGIMILSGVYEAFKSSLPDSLRETIPDILMVKGQQDGVVYELCSPEEVIFRLFDGTNPNQGTLSLFEQVATLVAERRKNPSVSSTDEVAKLSDDDIVSRFNLLENLSKFPGVEQKIRGNDVLDVCGKAANDPTNSGKKEKKEKEVLRMDKEISDLIVKQCEIVLNSHFDSKSKDIQKESLESHSACAQHFLALLEALTKNIDGGTSGSVSNPRTLLEALDLGERALTTDDAKPLWSFTFDNEDSETQFSAAEQLKREASFLSGMLIVGMGNTFADVETLAEARVAYAGTMISQLLSSSPLMREAVVEVMEEELELNPVSHLGTLSREMPMVSHKESAKAVHDMVGQFSHGSGDTSISGGKWTQWKKALEFILKRPTHWMIGLPLVASVAALVIGAGILMSSTVPGLIIAGTLTLSSGFLLMILGAFGITFQPQYFSLLFGLLFGTKRTVAKVFASDRLTQLWKVTQGDRKATLAYYKSKGLDDSSGVKLTRNRLNRAVLSGDLYLLQAQAAQEYVADMGNAGLEALIKSAEERLVKLGKLGIGYNSTGNKEEKRKSALMIANFELAKALPDRKSSKLQKVVKKAMKGKNVNGVVGSPEILGGIQKLAVTEETSNARKSLSAFPEIASLAGCLMREEALDNGDEVDRRRGGLAFAMDRVREVFFDGVGTNSSAQAVSGLMVYRGVQKVLFDQGPNSDYMNIPLPRNSYTTTTTATDVKLSDVRQTRLTVGGDVLSKQVLSFFNTGVKKVQLEALNEPLFPPGVGFDIPVPFRELKLNVTINNVESQGTFDDLVSIHCSKKSKKTVKQFTKRASNFPDLQGMIKNHRDSSVWTIAIQDFMRSFTISLPKEIENYIIIVKGLCKVLSDAEPGEAIGDSKIIMPGIWSETSLENVAKANGVDLKCIESVYYNGSSVYENLKKTDTKHEEQLGEFMRYMKDISAEHGVRFLTDSGYVFVSADKNVSCIQGSLDRVECLLGDFSPAKPPLSGDVIMFKRLVISRCINIRKSLYSCEVASQISDTLYGTSSDF